MLARVRAAGGEIVGLTSMAQADVDKASASWGIDFPLLADPSCALVDLLNERGWIASVVERAAHFTAESALTSSVGQYAVGMLQPGVLALRGPVAATAAAAAAPEAPAAPAAPAAAAAPLQPPQVLLSWASVPSDKNLQGATNRLRARDAWCAVEKSLAGDFSEARPPAELDGPPLPPKAVFLFLLMAHGNFVQPRFFVLDTETAGDVGRGGRSLNGMMKKAVIKAAVAVAVTATGLWRAPMPTAGALAAYAAYFYAPGGPYSVISTLVARGDAPSASRL